MHLQKHSKYFAVEKLDFGTFEAVFFFDDKCWFSPCFRSNRVI